MSNTDPLTIFRTLTTIPRDSGDEKKVAEYLISFAEKRGLEAVKDDADNVITVSYTHLFHLSSTAFLLTDSCQTNASVTGSISPSISCLLYTSHL